MEDAVLEGANSWHQKSLRPKSQTNKAGYRLTCFQIQHKKPPHSVVRSRSEQEGWLWKKIYLQTEVVKSGLVKSTSTVLSTGTRVLYHWRQQVSKRGAMTVGRGGCNGGEQPDMPGVLSIPGEVVQQLCFAWQVEAELLCSFFRSPAMILFTHSAHTKYRDTTKDMPKSNFCLLNIHHKLLYDT